MSQKPVEQRVRVIYFQTEDGNIYATDSRFLFNGPPAKKEEKDRRTLLGKFENMMIAAGVSPSVGKVVEAPMITTQLADGDPSQLTIMTILDEDIMKMKSYITTLSKRNDKLAGLLSKIHPAIIHDQNNRFNLLNIPMEPMVSYPTEPGETLFLAIQQNAESFRHTQSKVVAVLTHNISRGREVITSTHSGENKNDLQKKAFLDNSLHTHVNDGSERSTITFRELLADNTKSAIAIVGQDPKNPDYVYLENDQLSFDLSQIGKKAVVVPFSISDQAADELQSYHGLNTPFGTDDSFINGNWVPMGSGKNFNPCNLITTFLRLKKVMGGKWVGEFAEIDHIEIERKLDIREDDLVIKISPVIQNSLRSLNLDQLSVGQFIGLMVIYPNGRSVIRVGDISVLKKGVN